MELTTSYGFDIEEHYFYIDINWGFNLSYLENFLKYDAMYIDSALTFFTVQGISFSLAAEQNYGDLLDVFSDILEPCKDQRIVFESHTTNLTKHNNHLILAFSNEKFDCISFECSAELTKIVEKVRDDIISDFEKMANNIIELKILLSI